MKDRLITIGCGLCLVLCFAVIVSWARSTVSSEGITIGHQYGRSSLAASDGAIVFIRGSLVFDSPEIEQAWRSAIDPQKSYDWAKWRFTWSRDLGLVGPPGGTTLGFGFDTSVADNNRRTMMMPGIRWHRMIIQVPHWALILLFGAAPGVWLVRRGQARRERVQKGLCRKCGFEMGDVYHSCPKCGERAPLPEGFPVIETT